MLMGVMTIAVVMQRFPPAHRWADATWSAVAVVPATTDHAHAARLDHDGEHETWLLPGLQLELHRDEDDGYFENWAAPAPKVFVRWQMRDERPLPVLASVSYGEGTRMLDSGDCAEGVPMPEEVHRWLSAYLQAYYKPRSGRRREHG